ncbi:Ig-like domain-containing protein [Mycolicibacterium iranicum]|uniref:Uncharacterized protein n=1 Tax=Mycolicibacterium iranicum TaxID=912594 RepID=A0A178LZG8_MYCIR|nr:Ig-like domain-containing protein [Mycolicibacterium iranicum]OAN39458.1 hypothetical protein A4X20_17405 [Mycolicibacterium iranicum]
MTSSTVASYLGAAAFSAGLGLAVLAGAGAASADTTSDTDATSSRSSTADATHHAGPTRKADRAADNVATKEDSSDRDESDQDDADSSADDDFSADDGAGEVPARIGGDEDGAAERTDGDGQADPVEARVDDEVHEVAEVDAHVVSDEVVVDQPVDRDLRVAESESQAESVVMPSPVEAAATRASQPSAVGEPTFFEWLSRKIDYCLFNRKPRAEAMQLVQDRVNGVILGTMNATDREDDPLAYRVVVQAAKGDVTVSENGTFVYTPSAEFAAAGGTDVFAVKITDVGWGLHVFTGGRSTYVPVAVTVTPPSEEPPEYTRGFNVYNVTGSPVTFLGTQYGNVESAPAVGTRVEPGSSVRFELTYYFFSDNGSTASFVSDAGQYFYAHMGVLSPSGTSTASCSTGGAAGDCAPTKEDWTNQIVFLDAPGTVIDIPAGQGQKQAEVLNQLCYDGGLASCSFTPKKQENDFTPDHQVGNSVTNTTNAKVTYTISSSDTQTYSDSVQVSAKVAAKLGPIINAELSATYGHTWQTSHTFTQTIQVEVLPGTTFWIEARQPIFRVYGDLVLRAGNTTWILRDVYFESPNPNGNGNWQVLCSPSDTCSVQSGATLDADGVNVAVSAARRVED